MLASPIRDEDFNAQPLLVRSLAILLMPSNKQTLLTPRSLSPLNETGKDQGRWPVIWQCYVVRPNRLITYMRGGGTHAGPCLRESCPTLVASNLRVPGALSRDG